MDWWQWLLDNVFRWVFCIFLTIIIFFSLFQSRTLSINILLLLKLLVFIDMVVSLYYAYLQSNFISSSYAFFVDLTLIFFKVLICHHLPLAVAHPRGKWGKSGTPPPLFKNMIPEKCSKTLRNCFKKGVPRICESLEGVVPKILRRVFFPTTKVLGTPLTASYILQQS